jgi:hypothetical protein
MKFWEQRQLFTFRSNPGRKFWELGLRPASGISEVCFRIEINGNHGNEKEKVIIAAKTPK